MTQVYATPAGTTWHRSVACPALDDAAMWEGAASLENLAVVEHRRPCIVCSCEPAHEWTVTGDNIGELFNLIPIAKPYWSASGYGMKVTGLTLRPHAQMPRQVARIGDTIRLDNGRYTACRSDQL